MFLQKQSPFSKEKFHIPKELVLEASPHSTPTHQDGLQDVHAGTQNLLGCLQLLWWQATKRGNFMVIKVDHLF